jgi:hypothetical protein
MKRSELERKLKALGWAPTGKTSGANHDVWAHPKRTRRLYIRRVDVINVHTANRILEEAEG